MCEVKARTSDRFGTPFEVVGPDKQRRLRRLGAPYLAERRSEGTTSGSLVVGFDVAGVLGGSIEVREAAF